MRWTETPSGLDLVLALLSRATSGGGGIRTHEPPCDGQRFSRPPRSTTPAPLRGWIGGGFYGPEAGEPPSTPGRREPIPFAYPERCPSGLRSATGNRVGGVNPPRGFESHPLRSGPSQRGGSSAPAAGEELAQESCALLLAQAAGDPRPVVERGLAEHVEDAAGGARLGVGCAEDDDRDRGRGRSPRRTSRRAPGSRRGSSPAAASRPAPRPRRGSRGPRRGRSGRRAARARCPPPPGLAVAGDQAPIGTSPCPAAARARSIASPISRSSVDVNSPCGIDFREYPEATT